MTSTLETPLMLQSKNSQSAFTPVQYKPLVNKYGSTLFDPSPLTKMFFMPAYCHQYQNEANNGAKKVYSPPQITPTQMLKMQATPELQRLNSCYSTNMFMQQVVAPKSFSLDVIVPSSSVLAISPLRDQNEDNDYGSDNDRESTNHSSSSKDSKEHTSNIKSKNHVVVNGVVVDKYMFSDNLNECVDFLLQKQKIQTLNIKQVIRHNSSAKSKEKRRRTRKNKDQHLILLNFYKKNPNWEKNTIQRLSDQLGLSESQIYKWNWDQRKKDGSI